jgi:ATP-dependent RNA helicase SUPV3L1/SUV3
MVEAFGLVPRRAVAAQVHGLSKADRRVLADLGVRLGSESIFLPALLRARSARLRGMLWALHGKTALPPLPRLGRRVLAPAADLDPGLCQALGYRHLGGGRTGSVALRADALENLAREAQRLAAPGPFALTPRLKEVAGGAKAAQAALAALGYQVRRLPAGIEIQAPARAANGTAGGRRRAAQTSAAGSPFAKLRELDPER